MTRSFTRVLSPLLVLISGTASAANFTEKCPDLSACAKAVSELTGQKYIFESTLKENMVATKNLDFTAENAEILFTYALNASGYSRMKLTDGTFSILRQRDARDQAIPYVKCDNHTAPVLPDTWDLYTMKYQATNAEIVEHVARNSRSFMPANSRIIPDVLTGSVLITDTAPNLKKLYTIIREMDVKVTPAIKAHWEKQEKDGQARMRNAPSEGGPSHGGPPPADAKSGRKAD